MLLKPIPANEKATGPLTPATKAEPFYFWLWISYATLLLRDAMGGVLRYYADIGGLGSLWYLPDGLLAVFFILALTRVIKRSSRSAVCLIVVWLVYSIIGFFTSESLLSVLSAAKMILPLFAGLISGLYADRLMKCHNLHWFVFIVSVAGIIASGLHVFPWLNYQATDAMGQIRITSAERTIGEVKRLAGFASDNTTAGFAVMISGMLLMHAVSRKWQFVIFSIGLYAITLTTSRTASVAYFVTYLTLLTTGFGRVAFIKKIYVGCAILFVIMPFVLPLIGVGIEASQVPSWATSMVDRIHNTWVRPFAFLWEQMPFALVSGLGLGSVAFPALFSASLAHSLTSADNFMFANYLMFGLFGIVATLSLLHQSAKKLEAQSLAVLVGMLVYGMAVQGYGVSSYAFWVGLLLMAHSVSLHDRRVPT